MVPMFSRHYGDERCQYSPLWGTIDIRPHVNKGFPFIWLLQLVCIQFWHIYRPLWYIPSDLKWFKCSVGTMEMNHVNIRHYQGRSTSGPVLIRVSPLYGYYNWSVSNFDIFVSRLYIFRLNLNCSNIPWTVWRWTMYIFATVSVNRQQTPS